MAIQDKLIYAMATQDILFFIYFYILNKKNNEQSVFIT